MKLLAGRARNNADIVELLKAGASAETIRSFFSGAAAHLLPRFAALEEQASREAP